MSKTSISGSFPILIYSIPSMKNLIVRSLSGAVYVALIVCSILFGGGWAFPVLCCIFTFTGILEFQKMTQTDFYDSPRMLFVDLLIGLAIPAIVAMSFCGLPMLAILTGIATIILALTRLITQLYSHRENPLRHIAYSIMSVTYLALPLAAATGILFIDRGILLLMFVMIWLNDTGAFLVGSAIGSHRLFPRHSPKKSWEGFFGGMAFCIAAGYLAMVLIPDYFGQYGTVPMIAFGVVVCIMSTWGDLFESMLKRTVGVKDSGNIIPGHGGILDRIDSLLFVAPATLVFWIIVYILPSFTGLLEVK